MSKLCLNKWNKICCWVLANRLVRRFYEQLLNESNIYIVLYAIFVRYWEIIDRTDTILRWAQRTQKWKKYDNLSQIEDMHILMIWRAIRRLDRKTPMTLCVYAKTNPQLFQTQFLKSHGNHLVRPATAFILWYLIWKLYLPLLVLPSLVCVEMNQFTYTLFLCIVHIWCFYTHIKRYELW